MQLNKNTGEIIIFNRIYKDTGKVIYDEFENRIFTDSGELYKGFKNYEDAKLLAVDFSVLAEADLTVEANIESLFYDSLLSVLGADWSKSNDIQNWVYADKPIRFIISTVKSTQEMVSNLAYKELMDRMVVEHQGFINVGESNTEMYVATIIPGDVSIISTFINTAENPTGWIYVENKL